MSATTSETAPPSAPLQERANGVQGRLIGWQHPLVNVFRHFGVDRCEDARTRDVKRVMDKAIGKRVWDLQSSVAVATYIQLPTTRGQSLGLLGRFCYLQVMLYRGKEFLIQLDVQDVHSNVHRVTLSNLFRHRTHKRNVRGLQVPLGLEEDTYDEWLTLAVDLPELLKSSTETPFKCLRGLQLCANLRVRGVYTSDIHYQPTTLPKEMVLSMVQDPSTFRLMWIPKEPPVNPTEDGQEISIAEAVAVREPAAVVDESVGIPLFSEENRSPMGGKENMCPEAETPFMELSFVNGFSGVYVNVLVWRPNSDELVFAAGSLLVAMNGTQFRSGSAEAPISAGRKEQRYLIGHSAPVCCLSIDEEGVFLASGQEGQYPLIRLWNLQTGVCVAVLMGHDTGLITLDLSSDGRRLAAVGMDEQKRQVTTIWTLKPRKGGHVTVGLSSRTISLANIKCLKWSPYDPDRLLSCGRDNVRLHRIRDGKLRSMPIGLSTPLVDKIKSRVFTSVAFSGNLPSQKWIFIGCACGAVLHLDYERYCPLGIYPLQGSAVNCLAVSEGFCVVGSDDGCLRVWPLDFTDYLLEAKNDAAVTSVGLSADGLQICAGTQNGSISRLDIVSHTHETLLRSHTDAIHALSLLAATESPTGVRFLTGSADGTLRQWDLVHPSQPLKPDIPETDVLTPFLDAASAEDERWCVWDHVVCCPSYEFRCLHDAVLCTSVTADGLQMAAGFRSSWIRIFDLEAATIIQASPLATVRIQLPLQEFQQSGGEIASLAYSGDGRWLMALNREGSFIAYDASNGFRPVKQLFLTSRGGASTFAVDCASSHCVVATLIHNQTVALLIFCTDTLQLKTEIATTAKRCDRLSFADGGGQIWMLDCEAAALRAFAVSSGELLGEWSHPYLASASCFRWLESRELLVTGDREGFVRLWSDPLKSVFKAVQSFAGHVGEITDMQICGGFLISVGKDDQLLTWKLQEPPKWPPSEDMDAMESPKPEDTLSRVSCAALKDWVESPSVEPPPLAKQLAAGASTCLQPNFVRSPIERFCAFISESSVAVVDRDGVETAQLSHHATSISALCLSDDGALLATASSGVEISGYADICIWQTDSHQLTALLQHHLTKIQAVAFSVDSVWLVSMSYGAPCYVVVWDVASQKPVAVAQSVQLCRELHFLRDALIPKFITTSDDSVCRWELSIDGLHPQNVRLDEGIACGCVDVSGGFYCVTKRNALLYLEDGVWRKQDWRFEALSQITALSVSGSRIVMGTNAGELLLYGKESDASAYVELARQAVPCGVVAIQMEPCFRDGVASARDGTIWSFSFSETPPRDRSTADKESP